MNARILISRNKREGWFAGRFHYGFLQEWSRLERTREKGIALRYLHMEEE